jgi:hypothetical protein
LVRQTKTHDVRGDFRALTRISHTKQRIGAPNQRKLFCENDFARFEERPDADRV